MTKSTHGRRSVAGSKANVRCRTKTTKARGPRSDQGSAKDRGVTVGAEPEPNPEQMALEQTLLDESLQSLRNAARRAPAPGVDLLASYMEMLAHIPLFTPEQEIQGARNIETLELAAWQVALEHYTTCGYVLATAEDLDPEVVKKLQRLEGAFQRALARATDRPLKMTPGRRNMIEELAARLRSVDQDKEIFGRVVRCLRRETRRGGRSGESKVHRLDETTLARIVERQRNAMRARNNFVRANLRLVVSVARKFRHYRIPFIDLIQEGNVGLMKAVHRFDHRRGFRFSTYAHWWIRQSIERAIINKGTQVRLPVHVIDSRRQVNRARARLTQSLGRDPSVTEIARGAGLSATKVEEILAGVQGETVSLDEPVGDDDARKFLDMVTAEDQEDVDEAVIRENTSHRIGEILKLLNPIEMDIIRRRFGIGDDRDQTLDEIGQAYNLSRERIRQIQAQGLMKMRRYCNRADLYGP